MKKVVVIEPGGLWRQILSTLEEWDQNTAEYNILGFIVTVIHRLH
jgi:hypothetical protein